MYLQSEYEHNLMNNEGTFFKELNMNNFENFYNRNKDAKNAYDIAKNEDELNAARAA